MQVGAQITRNYGGYAVQMDMSIMSQWLRQQHNSNQMFLVISAYNGVASGGTGVEVGEFVVMLVGGQHMKLESGAHVM